MQWLLNTGSTVQYNDLFALSQLIEKFFNLNFFLTTVEPVLSSHCIKQPPALNSRFHLFPNNEIALFFYKWLRYFVSSGATL